jgi:predicted regulator of Ras-like GTPase activity (Roadblock/LC7/MglB family)
MPRLEEVLAELAAVPGVRAAALGGFDGLLVDEAAAPVTVADAVDAYVRNPADADVDDALISEATVTELLGREVGYDLDGAIVELTHAWHAIHRACGEHLEAGPARELVIVADGGVALAHTVGARWFALAWAAPSVDLGGARAALRRAAERLSEVVS